ncbi:MAG: hypothetical protein F6K31_32050 [Symploca sp. SIO2G7]|nr:hypothetical protein [Symploca sp. SIO2G7]
MSVRIRSHSQKLSWLTSHREDLANSTMRQGFNPHEVRLNCAISSAGVVGDRLH